MSAAFDTVDPGILSDTLSSHVGVEGFAILWFRSYICLPSLSELRSEVLHLEIFPYSMVYHKDLCQDQVLFSVCTSPLQAVIKRHNIDYLKYADDNILYTSLNPTVPGGLGHARRQLVDCFNEVRSWLATLNSRTSAESRTGGIPVHHDTTPSCQVWSCCDRHRGGYRRTN